LWQPITTDYSEDLDIIGNGKSFVCGDIVVGTDDSPWSGRDSLEGSLLV
jgi:hypothetical protein